jgi:DNA-directed RNA polymerase subunit RPC12/RpoP
LLKKWCVRQSKRFAER